MWNEAGDFFDTGTINVQIPANGNDVVLFLDGTTTTFVGSFQVLVNWSQAQDKPAPLPRMDMFPDGTYTSTLRTPCP
jgi:hypothetical protein